MMQNAFIPAHYLLQVLASEFLTKENNQQIRDFIHQSGISIEELENASAKIPLQWVEKFVTANQHFDPAVLAYQFGSQVKLTSLGDLSLVLMTSPTLRDALQVVRYIPLETNAATLSFTESDAESYLFVDVHAGSHFLNKVLLFYAIGAVEKLLTTIGGVAPELKVKVTEPQPIGFINVIKAPEDWQFNRRINCIVIPAKLLNQPGQFCDSVAHTAAIHRADKALTALEESPGIINQVKALLHDQKCGWNQEDIAEALHISRSTLKRHLARHGITYNHLLSQVRKQKAIELLLKSTHSFQEIAETLGYSDQSNFSHAFKKWMGVSPGEFRDKCF